MSDQVRRAAVVLLEREDGRVLCVWNRRYAGWSLPGGMVEPGEAVEHALVREVLEETSLRVTSFTLVHERSHEVVAQVARQDRASCVSVFRALSAEGSPRQVEPSSPVAWLTREEFLQWSPFGPFYVEVFERWEAFPALIMGRCSAECPCDCHEVSS